MFDYTGHMNRFFVLFFALIGFTLFVPVRPCPAADVERVRLTSGEWPPYLSEKLEHHGLVSHIVTRAFAEEGVVVEYGFFPWLRSLELTRSGSWDGSVVWLRTPEREQDFWFSDVVYSSCQAFFHRKDTPFDWEGHDDLRGLKIGMSLGYSHGEKFDKMVENGELDVSVAHTDWMNLNKLLSRRVDVFPVNVEIGYYLLRTGFAPGQADLVTHHPRLLIENKPLYLIVPRGLKRSSAILKVFNSGLMKLHDSGAFERLVEEWRRGEYLRQQPFN